MRGLLYTTYNGSSRVTRRCGMSVFPALCLALSFFVTGCGEDRTPAPQAYVIKCGDMIITGPEFSDELDLKLSAYPYDLKDNPQEYNAVVLDLISVLSDELLLLEAARKKEVSVSPDAASRAEAAIREDYPEDSFDQMLLENAITYKVWKKKLEKDMVIDKFVRTELIGSQEITPDDVIAFYQQYTRSGNNGQSGTLDEDTLISKLRMQKSQAAYDGWIKALKSRYPVEIDQKAVTVFLQKTKEQ